MRVRYADGEGPVRDLRAGSNYWSADGVVQVLGLRATPSAVWVRWPGGKVVEVAVPAGAKEITVKQ